MRNIKKLVIHCSDSPSGRGDTAETVHKWHLEKGWDGIGYHYVIDEDGIIESGRPEYWIGAHVQGHNDDSLGICLIGNGHYSPKQCASLIELLEDLLFKYPTALIYNHHYFNPEKGCPLLNDETTKIIQFFFKEKYVLKH